MAVSYIVGGGDLPGRNNGQVIGQENYIDMSMNSSGIWRVLNYYIYGEFEIMYCGVHAVLFSLQYLVGVYCAIL